MAITFYKRVLSAALLLSVASIQAHSSAQSLPMTHLTFGMDYLNVNMPDQQPKLGMTGLHLTHRFHNGLHMGAGIYAAVNGNYSGLFLLGPEVGYQVALAKHVNLYANAYAGTGGGHGLTNQLGSGGTLIASAGAMFPFQKFSMGLGYSIVRVDGGHIHSNQWIARLAIPLHLLLWRPLVDNSDYWHVSAHHLVLMPFAMLGVPNNAYNFSGIPLTNKSGLCGIELLQLLKQYWFYFLRGEASFYGGYSGYMDLSLGSGLQLPIAHSPLSAVLSMSLGTGGGGSIDLGGGMFYHPELGVLWHLSKRLDLNILGGYLAGFSGRYHLKTLLLGLGYHLNVFTQGTNDLTASDATTHAVSISLGNETYLNAQNAQDPNHAIQLVTLKFTGMLTKHWFADGETAFAYTGHIPGFATGLVGAGYRYQHHNMAIYAKLLAGAAGGGGIDAKGGFIIKPTVGLNVNLNHRLALYLEAGKLKAVHGNFAPETIDAGLVYHLNLLGANFP